MDNNCFRNKHFLKYSKIANGKDGMELNNGEVKYVEISV